MVENPAHYGWTSSRANAVGSPLLTAHAAYLALGAAENSPRMAYHGLFRYLIDEETISDIRLAPNQSQPLGNERFHAKIERMTGQRREARPRRRPR